MRARLLCKTGEHAGREHELGDSSIIGRNLDSDIPLQSDHVSGRHARIFGKQGAFYVEDLGSANGTWVDGHRISGPVRLDRLNVITFAGKIDFLFQLVDAEAQAEPERPTSRIESAVGAGRTERTPAPPPPAAAGAPPAHSTHIAPAELAPLPKLRKPAASAAPSARESPPPDAAETEHGTRRAPAAFGALPPLRKPAARASKPDPASAENASVVAPKGVGTEAAPAELGPIPELVRKPAARYALEVEIADGVTAIFDLREGRNTLGRATDCDITVNDLLVSRYHAVITVSEKTILEDAGSDNGIEVAGHRIKRAVIKVGTTFKIGPRIEARLVEL